MDENIAIAILAPVQPEDFFDLVWQGVWEATFDLGSFDVQVRDLTTEWWDLDGQREILNALLVNGVDAIGILPAHACALNDLIDKHELHGTPVVTFHNDAPASRRSAFVGPCPSHAGALAGEILLKIMGGPGRVVALPGLQDRFHLAERYRGFREELARRGGMENMIECSTPEELESLEPANGYYVGNQQLVEVASALEQLNINAPCVGFGNTPCARSFLRKGIISAIIDENRYQQGYFAVQKAYEAVLKRRATAPLASVAIPSTAVFSADAAVRSENVNDAFEMLLRQRTEILFSYKQRLEHANAKLADLAVTDPLTELYNRRKFEQSIQHEAARALRYGPVSLLMIDLNSFKLINDRFGHQTGDEVLKSVAQVLKASCRTTDTCARLGGDEFAVILPHSDRAAAVVVRERILRRIGTTAVAIEGQQLQPSLSIGIATLPEDAKDAPGLLAAADAAMYAAKAAFHSAETGDVPGILAPHR